MACTQHSAPEQNCDTAREDEAKSFVPIGIITQTFSKQEKDSEI